jgi:hypothetical protein
MNRRRELVYALLEMRIVVDRGIRKQLFALSIGITKLPKLTAAIKHGTPLFALLIAIRLAALTP